MEKQTKRQKRKSYKWNIAMRIEDRLDTPYSHFFTPRTIKAYLREYGFYKNIGAVVKKIYRHRNPEGVFRIALNANKIQHNYHIVLLKRFSVKPTPEGTNPPA